MIRSLLDPIRSARKEHRKSVDIIELLENRGLDTSRRIKMLRHRSQDYDVHDLYKTGRFEAYQAVQGHDRLKCDYVVSFLGLKKTRSLFVGVWRVQGSRPMSDVARDPAFPFPEWYDDGDTFFYDLEEIPGFEDIKDRVVIDWGRSTRSWHQWLNRKRPKTVIEILPVGHVADFPGYQDFILSFDELKRIVENPDANRIWHVMLGAVAGIYLITDAKTGQQYVGSAYGQRGVLGRWREYAGTGHGGNALLRELIEGNAGYQQNLRFTLLRTLPKVLTNREVIRYERLYKDKLGTRAHGLNLN